MQALTADRDFLLQRGNGRVEQVFSRAVNLYLPGQQRLLTLLCQDYDNAPNSCRLALTHFDGLFRPGEPVQFYAGGLNIGTDKWIDTTYSLDWSPPLLTFAPGQFRQIPWQRWRKTILQQLGERDTLFLYRGDNPFYQEMARQLQQRRHNVINALTQHKNISATVAQMMGLGIGLTPSSDDYLVGLSIILFIAGHPAEKYKEEFLSALRCARENTTLLSAVTFEAALNQRYRESIYRFINGIINEPHHCSIQAIANIKDIGSSSGCDMLYGMADGCALSQTYGGNYVSQNSH